jgi:flagellin-like hook-associated protein FlgL
LRNVFTLARAVSVQAANDTNSAQDRRNLQREIDALTTEINRILGDKFNVLEMFDVDASDEFRNPTIHGPSSALYMRRLMPSTRTA